MAELKKIILVISVILLAGLIAYLSFSKSGTPATTVSDPASQLETSEYNPIIDPSGFVPVVDNPYFTLTPGASFTYQGETSEGTEKIITIVTHKTKTIMGVTNIEVWDRVWLNDSLIEETYDWYAQDTEGTVWYFGEDSKEYENGKAINSKGSWEAGANGAEPGIIMKADPKVGDSYRQEYFKGEAEDMADVVSLSDTVTVPFGTFAKCLKTRDWSMIDAKLNEYKYYCPDASGLALEVAIDSGEKVELINVSK